MSSTGDLAALDRATVEISLAQRRLEECLRRRAAFARRLQALLEEERALDDLERSLVRSLGARLDPEGRQSVAEPPAECALNEVVRAFERRLIEQALEACGGVQREAAALLGIGPTTFNEKLRRLGLRNGRQAPQAPRPPTLVGGRDATRARARRGAPQDAAGPRRG